MMCKGTQRLVLAAGIVLVAATLAWPHKVNLFAYIDGGQVFVEGYFSANSRAVDCMVEVLDSRGTRLVEGKTDAKGLYSLRLEDLPPFEGGLTFLLHAGMGHKAEYTLAKEDLFAASREIGLSKQAPHRESSEKAPLEDSQPMSLAPNEALVKKAVEEALETKLEPILKMLAGQRKLLMEQKERGPSLTEIIGGIGWIFGIVGVTAYFMSLRRSRGR